MKAEIIFHLKHVSRIGTSVMTFMRQECKSKKCDLKLKKIVQNIKKLSQPLPEIEQWKGY
jgi:pyocin large subunit-like protein